MLDTWGTLGRPDREIAEWLTEEHGISNWWAQKLIVEYQQARGLRAPGVRPDQHIRAATASKTLAVPGERAFEAFVDAKLRERWLPGAVMHERTSQPGRSARFNWEDGVTRVNVDVSRLPKVRVRRPWSTSVCLMPKRRRGRRRSGGTV